MGDLDALRRAAEHAREQHRNHVVVHAQRTRAARGLAVGNLFDHSPVVGEQGRSRARRRHQRGEIHPRHDLELLVRAGQHEPDVVRDEEGDSHAQALEIAVPPQRTERQGGRVRPHHRQRERTEGSRHGGVTRELRRDGHARVTSYQSPGAAASACHGRLG